MIQFENFSDKAKQVIELVKNCRYKTQSKTITNHDKGMMILYACSLFNIWPEYDDVLDFCKSKNYWLENSK